jgi:hypothetical protein
MARLSTTILRESEEYVSLGIAERAAEIEDEPTKVDEGQREEFVCRHGFGREGRLEGGIGPGEAN